MAFSDGQVVTAAQLNDLANKDDLGSAVEAKVNEINGYDLSAASSAESAAASSATAQSSITLAQAAADQAAATLSSTVKGANTFATGATLESMLDQINDGTNLYYWTGTFPKIVPAGATPEADGFGIGLWAVAGDAPLRKAFSTADGFKMIGSVASFDALRATVPTSVGQKIHLLSYYDNGWAAEYKSPKGAGLFVAINSAGVDDGGTIAAVNSYSCWRRIINGPYTPEMFGAVGDLSADDMPAIKRAVDAAALAGADAVRGHGEYLIQSSYTIPAITHTGSVSGSVRLGFELYLNTVVVDADAWSDVPATWWDAQAAFYPADGVEHLRLIVDNFDGGGKATFFHTKGGRMATSHIHVGCMRNYIVGVRNLYDMSGQCTMINITGRNWQDGFLGTLIGGTGNGGGNSECWLVDVNWFANQRYGGISLQDRSQYAKIIAGTYDYNSKWTARLILENVVKASDFSVQFGDVLTSNGVSGYALSNILNGFGSADNTTVHITESADKTDGASDYTIGQTISNADGSFTATISNIELCSTSAVRYFDVIVSNVSAGFSRCKIDTTYGGGVYGANMFSNEVWAPNAVAGTNTANFMGLQPGGSSADQYWYMRGIFGETPFFHFNSLGITVAQDFNLNANRIKGFISAYDMTIGNPVTIFTFAAAQNITHSDLYEVFSVSSVPGQVGSVLVQTSPTGITIINPQQNNIAFTANGFSLIATLSGTDGTIQSTATRRI